MVWRVLQSKQIWMCRLDSIGEGIRGGGGEGTSSQCISCQLHRTSISHADLLRTLIPSPPSSPKYSCPQIFGESLLHQQHMFCHLLCCFLFVSRCHVSCCHPCFGTPKNHKTSQIDLWPFVLSCPCCQCLR